MQIRLINKLPLALLLSCTLAFTSCQQDQENTPQEIDAESAEANALAEAEFASIDEFIAEGAQPEQYSSGSSGCVKSTFNRDTHTLTIDFGTTNCTCRDGLNRRGKIMATFAGTPFAPGSSVTVTLQDYFVNDNQLKGTKTSTYLGSNKVSVKVKDASISTPAGTATWQADRVLEQVAGTGTLTIQDDVWHLTGSASGVNRKGVAYTAEIKQPLKRVLSAGCARNFVAGVLLFKNERGGMLELNYDQTGKEPCDNIATVTVNGKSKQITLR